MAPERTSMHLTLHVGAHKTASTTFQHLLRMSRDEFERCGVTVVGKSYVSGNEDLYRSGPRRALAKDSSKESLEAFATAYTEFIKALPTDSVILSDEDILGRLFKPDSGFYPDSGAKLSTLLDHLKPSSVCVILYVRSQPGYMESCFKELFNMGTPMLFERYLTGVDIETMSWLSLADSLKDVVGSNALIVRPYENIRRVGASTEFSAMVAQSTPGAGAIKLDAKTVSNVSLGPGARLRIWRAKQKKMKRAQIRAIAHNLRQNANPARSDKLLPAMYHDAMIRHYAAENTELFRKYMPDFDPAALGYA